MSENANKYDQKLRIGLSCGAIVSDEPLPGTPANDDSAAKCYGGRYVLSESSSGPVQDRIIACYHALAGIADPEAAVKGARTALLHAERSMKQMADTHRMETPSSCAEIYALCAMALGMLGGGE